VVNVLGAGLDPLVEPNAANQDATAGPGVPQRRAIESAGNQFPDVGFRDAEMGAGGFGVEDFGGDLHLMAGSRSRPADVRNVSIDVR